MSGWGYLPLSRGSAELLEIRDCVSRQEFPIITSSEAFPAPGTLLPQGTLMTRCWVRVLPHCSAPELGCHHQSAPAAQVALALRLMSGMTNPGHLPSCRAHLMKILTCFFLVLKSPSGSSLHPLHDSVRTYVHGHFHCLKCFKSLGNQPLNHLSVAVRQLVHHHVGSRCTNSFRLYSTHFKDYMLSVYGCFAVHEGWKLALCVSRNCPLGSGPSLRQQFPWALVST